MSLKFLSIALLLSLVLGISANAAEPIEGVRHKFENSNHHWQLDGAYSPVLSIFEGQSQSTHSQYDLSNCMFCSGEDDNCESDGVVELKFTSRPEEPILAAICHIGAHSQRLQILAPLLNQSEAVYTATGAYYITFEKGLESISIEYDTRADDGTFAQIVESWP